MPRSPGEQTHEKVLNFDADHALRLHANWNSWSQLPLGPRPIPTSKDREFGRRCGDLAKRIDETPLKSEGLEQDTAKVPISAGFRVVLTYVGRAFSQRFVMLRAQVLDAYAR